MWPHKPTTKNNQTLIVKLLKESRFQDCHPKSLQNLFIHHLLILIILLIVIGGCLADACKKGDQQDSRSSINCHNFTFGHNQEIFSPNFPRNYPKNLDCLRTIEAPEGHVVRLEFHESFDIEDSTNCEHHDYLEVRDGPYIFSEFLGRYCGHTFPQELTSSGRNFWLRFRSDDNIEYGGFKIIYKFIVDKAKVHPDYEECKIPLNGVEGTFGTNDITEERFNYSRIYNASIHCIWEITVPIGWQIYVTFSHYTLEHSNDCDLNYITFYTNLLKCKEIKSFCGSLTEPVSSDNSTLYVLYYASSEALMGNFSALFSAFRTTNGDCDSNEFSCGDDTCIAASLRCNGKDNCKSKTDEEGCSETSSFSLASPAVQIILIIGLGLLLSILVPSCLNCYRKMKSDGSSDSSGGGAGETSTQASTGQRTVEGSLHESQLVGVIGSGTYGGQTNAGANMEEDDENGCYVPEVDLSVFIKRSNGGHSILQHEPPFCGQETSLDSNHPFDSADPLIATAPPPPILPLVPQLLCISHGKNLRSAFQNGHPRGAMRPLRTSTPPTQPPHQHPLVHLEHCNATDDSSYSSENDNNNSFLTFLPPPPTLEEVEESDAIFGLPPTASPSGQQDGTRTHNHPRRFKAEAIIEMQNRRPRSFESTKSAPDVIGRV